MSTALQLQFFMV